MNYGTRIAVINADDLIREGRLLLLRSQIDFQVVYESGDPVAALEVLPDYLVDVIVVELITPGFAPEKYIEELSNRLISAGNDAVILATSNFTSTKMELEAFKAGASGFTSMEEPAEKLIGLVKALGNGSVVVDAHHLHRLLTDSESIKQLHAKLALELGNIDDSQKQVLKKFLDGAGDAAIANQFDLTKYRVTKFIESLREICGFRTRIQLAIALIELDFNE